MCTGDWHTVKYSSLQYLSNFRLTGQPRQEEMREEKGGGGGEEEEERKKERKKKEKKGGKEFLTVQHPVMTSRACWHYQPVMVVRVFRLRPVFVRWKWRSQESPSLFGYHKARVLSQLNHYRHYQMENGRKSQQDYHHKQTINRSFNPAARCCPPRNWSNNWKRCLCVIFCFANCCSQN